MAHKRTTSTPGVAQEPLRQRALDVAASVRDGRLPLRMKLVHGPQVPAVSACQIGPSPPKQETEPARHRAQLAELRTVSSDMAYRPIWNLEGR